MGPPIVRFKISVEKTDRMVERKDIDWERVKEEYREGASLSFLARKWKTTPGVVRDHLKKMGVRIRSMSEQVLFRTGGWRLLRPIQGTNTRFLSLPGRYLEQMGFTKEDVLEGKWVYNGGKRVTLMVRRRQEWFSATPFWEVERCRA